jgi:hypothetical protein
MIRIFALNVSEEILNKFKDFEIHQYVDSICIPIVHIYEDDNLKYEIINADYGRINACILKLRGREESS